MVAHGVPRFFADLEDAIALVGPYDHVKRAVAHHVLGATTMPTVIKHMMTYTDTRVPLMVAIQSGQGKGEVERCVRLYAGGPTYGDTGERRELLRYVKPTYRNEQELLGYVETRKPKRISKLKKSKVVVTSATPPPSAGSILGVGATAIVVPPAPVTIPHEGFLSYDLLMLNEFAGELVDPAAKQFRDWVNIALDAYGRNEIYKRLLRETALRYAPKVSPCVMVQPQQIPVELLYSGWVRRYLWVVGPELTPEQRGEIRRLVLRTHHSGVISDFVYDTGFRIRSLVEGKDGLRFGFGSVVSELRQAWEHLVELAIVNTPKSPELAPATMFNQRDWLYKLSANYAIARLAEFSTLNPYAEVDNSDVQMAYEDLLTIMPPMYRYLDDHLGELTLANVSPIGRLAVGMLSLGGPMVEAIFAMLFHKTFPNLCSDEQLIIEVRNLLLQGVLRQHGDGKLEVQFRR